MFKTYSIDTPFGVVEVTPTDGHHVHVSAGSSGRNRIEYRGSSYYLSLHLGLYDGQWLPYRDEGGQVSRTYLTLVCGIGSDAPKTYRAAIEKAVTEAVRAFLDTQKDVLATAELEKLEREVDAAFEAVVQQEKVLAAARQACNKAGAALRDFKLSLGKK
jgi:hypothetical protein